MPVSVIVFRDIMSEAPVSFAEWSTAFFKERRVEQNEIIAFNKSLVDMILKLTSRIESLEARCTCLENSKSIDTAKIREDILSLSKKAKSLKKLSWPSGTWSCFARY